MSSKKENNHLSLISLTYMLIIPPLVLLCFFIPKHFEEKTTKICAKKGVITSIDKVYQRTVYYTIDNKIKISVSQPKIAVGDPVCLLTAVALNDEANTIKLIKHHGIIEE